MRQAPGEAVQKLCPRCSALAFTTDRRCPWCGSAYRRRIVPALAVLLLVQTALLLGGMAYLAVLAGDEVDTRVDREVTRFERDLDTSFDRVRREVRRELEARPPPAPDDGLFLFRLRSWPTFRVRS
jgi:hypothetical protein